MPDIVFDQWGTPIIASGLYQGQPALPENVGGIYEGGAITSTVNLAQDVDQSYLEGVVGRLLGTQGYEGTVGGYGPMIGPAAATPLLTAGKAAPILINVGRAGAAAAAGAGAGALGISALAGLFGEEVLNLIPDIVPSFPGLFGGNGGGNGAPSGVVKSWDGIGGSKFFLLVNGRTIVRKRNGVMKLMRKPRMLHMKISNPRMGDVVKADKVVRRVAKILRRRLK